MFLSTISYDILFPPHPTRPSSAPLISRGLGVRDLYHTTGSEVISDVPWLLIFNNFFWLTVNTFRKKEEMIKWQKIYIRPCDSEALCLRHVLRCDILIWISWSVGGGNLAQFMQMCLLTLLPSNNSSIQFPTLQKNCALRTKVSSASEERGRGFCSLCLCRRVCFVQSFSGCIDHVAVTAVALGRKICENFKKWLQMVSDTPWL